jgi:hypothetical protein
MTFLRELRWRLRLTDAQAIRLSEFRCRWFPYRTTEWRGHGDFGPTLWQWPEVFGRELRG